MDYRRFLRAPERRVLPCFGGRRVEAPERTLRLAAPVEPGWWSFEVEGRSARAVERAEPDSGLMDSVPVVRGHFAGERLVTETGVGEEVYFLPEDEPPLCAPMRARRWPSGQLLFETLDFESEAELEARERLEDGRGLSGLKGVVPSLRAAFGYAVATKVAARLGVPVSAAELRGRAMALSEHAEPWVEAESVVRELVTHRIIAREERAARSAVGLPSVAWAAARPARLDEVVERVLEAAGAELLALRSLGDHLEVTYRFEGERFLAVVDRHTLQVVDAGICLAGEDQLVTLHSLPGVVRQAIVEGKLVITRRASRA